MSELFYGQFYGFDSAPFHTVPDASLLFATETHQQALGAIEYGIASGKGFIVITGEVGVGKTTVLRTCLDRLDSSKIKVIYVFNPDLKPLALYQTILDELETSPAPPRRPVNTLHRLQRALLTAHKAGYQVILAIDEAQNMPAATLESLRILSNLETAVSKLMQIVLVGQPELEDVLSKHTMRQLAQRIAVRATIRSLTWRQSRQYILYRLQCAGRMAGRPLFTMPALWYVAFKSRGIPRAINILCDNALISGYADSAERLSLRMVREACRPLRLHPRMQLGGLAAASTVFVVLIAAGVSYLGLTRQSSTGTSHDMQVANKVAVSAPVSSGGGPIPTAAAVPVASTTAVMQADAPPVPPVAVQSVASDEAAPAEAGSAEAGPAEAGPATVLAKSDTLAGKPTMSSSEPSVGAPMPGKPDPSERKPASSTVNRPEDKSTISPINQPEDAKSASTEGQPALWKWLVRSGDTVSKLCRIAYGVCDEDALQSIYKYNPQIGSDHMILVGEVIVMPERVIAGRSN